MSSCAKIWQSRTYRPVTKQSPPASNNQVVWCGTVVKKNQSR